LHRVLRPFGRPDDLEQPIAEVDLLLDAVLAAKVFKRPTQDMPQVTRQSRVAVSSVESIRQGPETRRIQRF
jgi:hypothetical protein